MINMHSEDRKIAKRKTDKRMGTLIQIQTHKHIMYADREGQTGRNIG